MKDHFPTWARLAILAVLTALAALLPYVGLQEYTLSILTLGLFFAVYAMNWDLLFGYAGEANFGATFLIGTGAYTAAMMSSNGIATPLVCVAAGAGRRSLPALCSPFRHCGCAARISGW